MSDWYVGAHTPDKAAPMKENILDNEDNRSEVVDDPHPSYAITAEWADHRGEIPPEIIDIIEKVAAERADYEGERTISRYVDRAHIFYESRYQMYALNTDTPEVVAETLREYEYPAEVREETGFCFHPRSTGGEIRLVDRQGYITLS